MDRMLDRLDELSGYIDTSRLWLLRTALITMVQNGVPEPRLFSTEEGSVCAEWNTGDWSARAEINPGNFDTYFHAYNATTREGKYLNFDLSLAPNISVLTDAVKFPDKVVSE